MCAVRLCDNMRAFASFCVTHTAIRSLESVVAHFTDGRLLIVHCRVAVTRNEKYNTYTYDGVFCA